MARVNIGDILICHNPPESWAELRGAEVVVTGYWSYELLSVDVISPGAVQQIRMRGNTPTGFHFWDSRFCTPEEWERMQKEVGSNA